MTRGWLLTQTLVLAALVTNACSTPALTPTAQPAPPPTTEIASSPPPTPAHIPAATSTHVPTFTAIPTTTPVPSETATSVPTDAATATSLPSPTTAPPTATAAPALEPVILSLRGREGRQETVDAHRPMIGKWGWGVCNSDVLTESLSAITFEVTVDGTVVATGNLAERRSSVREEDTADGIHVWFTDWTYPMGAFGPGTLHSLEVEWHLSHAVTDGCDSDGDGHLDVFGPGVLLVQMLEVTVQ
jgi:hypothetical protein